VKIGQHLTELLARKLIVSRALCAGAFSYQKMMYSCVLMTASYNSALCLKKDPRHFKIILAEMLIRKGIKRYHIFSPHVANASALPCETGVTEMDLFA